MRKEGKRAKYTCVLSFYLVFSWKMHRNRWGTEVGVFWIEIGKIRDPNDAGSFDKKIDVRHRVVRIKEIKYELIMFDNQARV